MALDTRGMREQSVAEEEPKRDRTRWWIVWTLFCSTAINYISRQTLSVLAPVLRQRLHLSNAQYGRVVSAFQFGMMSGEFPMGWVMDSWGVRLGLGGAVLWWSLATAAQSVTKPLPGTTGGAVRSAYSSFLAKGVFDPRSFSDTTMDPNFGPDKVHSWSLGIEREGLPRLSPKTAARS